MSRNEVFCELSVELCLLKPCNPLGKTGRAVNTSQGRNNKQTRYPEEFKIEAVKQITKRKYPAADVVARLGVSTDKPKNSTTPLTKTSSKTHHNRTLLHFLHLPLRKVAPGG
jgi:hypothetical protein